MWTIKLSVAVLLIMFGADTTQAEDSGIDDISAGLLPALNCAQKVHLFGSAVKLKQASGARSSRSMDDILDSMEVEFPSPVSNETVSLKLREIVGKEDVEEGRGRLKKIIVPLLLALTITAAIVIPALMTVIKLIAVKGLWSGVVSLIISKLIGLKALLHHHHHSGSSDEGKRPYVFYLPHGKRRREEEDSNYQGYQGPDLHWNQNGHDNWSNWRRESVGGDNFQS